MPLAFKSALEYGLDPAAQLLNRGFADYHVPVMITAGVLMAMVRQDSVDLGLSRVVFSGDQPVGAALIARRGWASRLAAMALIPEARGRGVGRALVRHLLGEAAARGERAMTLEVIEQNTPAVRLYEACGFRRLRRLVGYAGRPDVGAAPMELEPVDVREAARALIAYSAADLPWQLSGETLAQAGPPSVAYGHDSTCVVLSDPAAPNVVVRAVVTAPHARRQGRATAILRAAIARHPDKQWQVSAIWPEELGGLFEKIGLRRQALTQWQMTATL